MASKRKAGELPPRMYRKSGIRKNGEEWESFYHICNDPITRERVEVSLGTDRKKALIHYAKVEKANANKVPLMKNAFDKYLAEILPTKSPRTQKDTKLMLKPLRKVFDNAPIDTVTPQVIAKYRDVRSQDAPIRANREMALMSTVWNHAREWGYTEKENPCRGVRKNKEKPRDFYVDDSTWQAVYQHGCQELKDAMDLAYLTGQRPTDVLNFKFTDLCNGVLQVSQRKTKRKLNILLATSEGELNELGKVINRIIENGGKSRSDYLVCNSRGGPLCTQTLRLRFNAAKDRALVDADDELREKINLFQFRDIRPKAASELQLEHASALLGHTKEEITERVYRRKGITVTPTK